MPTFTDAFCLHHQVQYKNIKRASRILLPVHTLAYTKRYPVYARTFAQEHTENFRFPKMQQFFLSFYLSRQFPPPVTRYVIKGNKTPYCLVIYSLKLINCKANTKYSLHIYIYIYIYIVGLCQLNRPRLTAQMT